MGPCEQRLPADERQTILGHLLKPPAWAANEFDLSFLTSDGKPHGKICRGICSQYSGHLFVTFQVPICLAEELV